MRKLNLLPVMLLLVSCNYIGTTLKQERAEDSLKNNRDVLRLQLQKLDDKYYFYNEKVDKYFSNDFIKSEKYMDSMKIIHKEANRIYDEMYPKNIDK